MKVEGKDHVQHKILCFFLLTGKKFIFTNLSSHTFHFFLFFFYFNIFMKSKKFVTTCNVT